MLYRPRTSSELYCNVIILSFKLKNLPAYLIGHFRNERTTGAEMRSAIVFGIVTRNAPVSLFANFSAVLVIVPGDFFLKCAQKSL